jgi:hypothetical protein
MTAWGWRAQIIGAGMALECRASDQVVRRVSKNRRRWPVHGSWFRAPSSHSGTGSGQAEGHPPEITWFQVRSHDVLFRKIAQPYCPRDDPLSAFSRYFTPLRNGQKLATGGGMNARKVLDGQPGATPVIRTDGKNVTFRFELVGLQEQLRLALRCDPNGNVWAAIVSETDRADGQ